ncbi:hypothetical protein LWI29_006321 [Acer saccharum]|uniref:Protein kinase domain-containing protein n=1 Tax=Acer saccharum TaxID=4024 RepID=A0AA39RP04_ACESA|nr:hypothetical protein LWI29_006321 [Acer saccharum]
MEHRVVVMVVVVVSLLLFFFFKVSASDSLLSPEGVNYEVAALMAVKNKMRDEFHVLDGWDINSVDPCTWYMVGCSVEGFVVSLEMASMGLSGTISPSIGSLSHLKTMLLHNNQLSGTIPAELGMLSELQALDLSGNQFVGDIPSSLGFLHHLTYFYTGNNFLCTSSLEQICIGASKPVNGSSLKTRDHRRWVLSVALGISCTFGVSVMLLVCWVYWYRSRHLFTSYVQQDYEFDIGHLKRFSFRELQVATGNFSAKNILGQGGYGVVYKGCLPNRTIVAVKRLKDPNYNGEIQFQTEVEMIGLALHRNLLRLYGFCMTPGERLLVYPYMPNGSVADRLRAVVGDFGLAKLLDRRDSHVTTAVRGTVGHIAPEYLSTGQSSEKTDVFGFGILLLELITGQKALDAGNGQVQKGMILDWVRTLHEEKRLEVLVDRDLKGCFDASNLEKAVELALQCTQSNPNIRPKMSEVLKVLEELVGQFGMEESQVGNNLGEARDCSFSRNYSDVHEESSIVIEAMELSGPR